jgi:hypothetical protein
MKTGIELIAQERKEQIEKHGRTLESDAKINIGYTLSVAARSLIKSNPFNPVNGQRPLRWNEATWDRMIKKSYKERLIIAGALIAAEIDRLQREEVIND